MNGAFGGPHCHLSGKSKTPSKISLIFAEISKRQIIITRITIKLSIIISHFLYIFRIRNINKREEDFELHQIRYEMPNVNDDGQWHLLVKLGNGPTSARDEMLNADGTFATWSLVTVCTLSRRSLVPSIP